MVERKDIGKIEGGLVKGMGWMKKEEMVWEEKGRIRKNEK